MLATRGRRTVAGGVVLLVLLGALLYLFLTRGSAAPTAPAKLQIYVGTVQVAPSNANFSSAVNGATLNEGDTVKTLALSKAAINYADGSLTRMDSDTKVQLKVIDHPGNSYNAEAVQTAGRTWNRVKSLVGGSTFKTDGPNSSTAEARGTDYLFWILPDGTIKVDDFSGSVDFAFAGKTVHLTAGQFSQSAPGGPTTPAPIPAADLTDPFVLFNQAANANPGAAQTAIGPDNVLSTGQSSNNQDGYVADGNSDLAFTLNWPGSTFGTILIGPDGTEYPEQDSSTPPYTLVANHALAGKWRYRVHDQKSGDKEPWQMVIGQITPSAGSPQVIFPTAPKKCEYTVTAGQTEQHRVRAYSYSGLVTFAVSTDLASKKLPDYASLKDNKDGTADITFSPPVGLLSSVDIEVTLTGSEGAGSSSSDCVEHVLAGKASSITGSVTAGGTGVANVLLTLTLPDQSQTTSFTDAAGNYSFGALGAGSYTDTVTVPSGYTAASPTSIQETLDGAAPGPAANFLLTVNAAPPSAPSPPPATALNITNTALAPTSAGGLYAPRLSALGGIPPYRWSATGLIGGLNLDATTGELSGTAKTGNGATNITFKVTDAVGNSASSTLPVQVYSAPVVASFVRQAELGMPFSYTPPPPSPGTAGPYQWSAFGKPAWLSLNTATGALTGTPRSRDADKSEFFALQAADAYGSLSAPVAEEIDVNSALVMSPFDASSFTGGIVGAPYFTEPSRAFYYGTTPITYAITGALPPGLNVNCTVDCFQISGVPTTAGAYPVVVRATDALGASLSQARTIYIGSCPIGEALSVKGAVCLQSAFAPAGGVLPMATTGVPYSATVSVPGGAAPFQASEDTSSFGQGLLAGLSLTADNAGNITIFGTPNLGTGYGNFSFVLRVNDSATPNQTAAEVLYTIPVAGPTGGTSACSTGAVMPAVLSNGDVGAAYPATQMTVPGCTPNVQTWSATGLPAGLGITPTGALSGTPNLAGTYNFTITGSDPNQKTWTRSYSIKIGGAFAQNSSFSPTTYASTVNNYFYLPTIGVPTNNGVATGGLGPYVYRLAPGNFLPPHLTLGETAGYLYGNVDSPCLGNSCGFSIDVTDAAGQTVRSVQLTLTTAVAPINPYTRNAALPVANQPYYDVVAATGGVPVFFPGYTFTMTSGALPTGLYLAPDGVIYGTPTVPLEQYSFDVTATDSLNNTGTLTLSGTVSDLALATNLSALPPGEAGVNYHFQLAVTGGSGSFYWNGYANRCGAAGRKGNYGLPKYGCGGPYYLDYSTGTFSGNVAIDSGSVGVTWQSVSVYDQQTNAHIDTYFPIIIGRPLVIATASLPPTSQGGGYGAQLVARGGAGPYTWSATGLPAGLTLSPEGNLTGSAAAAGTFPVTFTVTDGANQNADPAYALPAPITKVLNIVVYGPVTINTTALPNGSTGHAYSLAVLANGGAGGNTWSASNLPSGLSIDPASGTIQGTSTAAQARMVYLTVTDKYGSSSTVALPLTISP